MENNTILSDSEKLAIKRAKRNEAMRKYRANRSEACIRCRNESNKRYYQKIKEVKMKYKELLDSGLIEKLKQLELNNLNN